MQKTIYALITIMAVASPAFAQAPAPRPAQPQAAPPSKGMAIGDTGQFAAKATMSNMLEIETSRMALERTKQAAIRDYAQTMIADHTKAWQELDAILKEANANAPVSKLDATHQLVVDRLKKADAARFDREYVAVQVKAHEEAVALFRKLEQYANPLGLFSEAIEPSTGELLGNFPQAYTHVGLIHAAITIGEIFDARSGLFRAWT